MPKQALTYKDNKHAAYNFAQTLIRFGIGFDYRGDLWFELTAHANKHGKCEPIFEFPWQRWIYDFKKWRNNANN